MTAKDLLHLIFEYSYLWSEAHAANSKPGKVRLQQIYALQTALGLNKPNPEKSIWQKAVKFQLPADNEKPDLSNIEYLIRGKFITDRPNEHNAKIDALMRSKVDELFSGGKYWEEREIPWLFNKLFHYRQQIYNSTYPPAGIMEGFSYGVHYANYLMEQLNNSINENIAEIDDTLWLILDPEKRDISMDILIRDFNYPDVNLKDIEHEWLMDNY